MKQKSQSTTTQLLRNNQLALEQLQVLLKDSLQQVRDDQFNHSKRDREELQASLKLFNESVLKQMTDIASLQRGQLDSFSKQLSTLTESNEKKLESMRETIQKQINALHRWWN